MCTQPLGSNSQNCDSTTGISEMNYTGSCNIILVTFGKSGVDPTDPTDPACCPEGFIESFSLDFDDPLSPKPEELLQPIVYVQQDDDTGAFFNSNTNYEGGSKKRDRDLSFQVEGHEAETECVLDSMVGKEPAFHVKFKDGQHKLINWSGGMKVTSVQKDSNTSYWTVTMSGRPNDRDLFINPTWANTFIVPVSVNPNGLVRG